MASMIKSKSFSPIIYSDTKILILGSLPGKKSLELKQYYGHARNRIWKILSHLTGGDIPILKLYDASTDDVVCVTTSGEEIPGFENF